MPQVILIPGALTALSDIDIPAMYPRIRALRRVSVVASATDVLTESVKTIIYTGEPAAGQVILIDEDTIHIGDATTNTEFIILDYVAKGEYSGA